jgi:hypothetical protein
MLTIHFRDGREPVKNRLAENLRTENGWAKLLSENREVVGFARMDDLSLVHFGEVQPPSPQPQPLSEIPA